MFKTFVDREEIYSIEEIKKRLESVFRARHVKKQFCLAIRTKPCRQKKRHRYFS